MSKMKYFIILMTVILMSLTICAAADSENLTQTDTHSIGYEIESHNDENNILEENDNNINHKEQALDTDNNIQKKSQENIKTQETTNITTVTQDNYNDYLTISNEKVTLNQNYFVPSNNYIINLTYFPSDTNQFEVNMDNPEYENDNITIVGNGITITNTNIILNKASMNSIILKDIVLNYTPEYDGDYVDVSSVTLNGVTINVDTQRESLSVPLNINGENTLIENCTINANLPSTQIPWEIDPEILEIPQGTGILITEGNVTLRNNVIQVSESSIIDASGYYKSLFGIYIGGDYTTLCNNTVLMTGTQYCYGVVIRSLNNIMSDNNVYVESEYYAAGINIEGNAIKNNLICGNNIDVSAGYNETDMENPDVAYGCLILDKSCGGENYVASSNSMYNNSYINNTVNVDARQVYGFELWGGVNNTIYGNNVTVTGNYPMGIGAIGINTTMDNNTIIAEGTSNSSEFSVDYIRPRTAGIYSYGMKEGNRITNNTVYVNNGRALLMEKAKNLAVENNFLVTEDYSYVIEVNDINNTFKYNAIMGEGTTEEVINDTTDNKNTYINNREPTNSTLTINAPEYVSPNEQNNIIISLKDQEEKSIPNQQITVKIGDNDAQTLITNNEGKCTLPVTITETTQIIAEYDCYEDCGSSATQEIIVQENNSTNPVITINEYNYNNYLTISSAGKVTLKQAYFVPGKNYTVNFAYLPTEAKQLAINNFYNNKYKNDTLTISGTINNINLQLSKGNLKSLNLEGIVLNYDNDYTGDYVNIPSMIGINNVTINVDTQRNSTVNVLTVGANSTVESCTINLNASGNTPTIALNISGENSTARNCIINANITSNRTSSPLYVGGENSIVENCTINANIPSSQVAWDDNSLPKGIGVWINAFYTTIRNNRFNFSESCILSDGTHRSLYGVYVRGINTNIYNNTLIVNGTQYSYGFVVRASQNRIYDNNITINSVYYSAGVNIEGNGMKNNYITNNFINVSAGFEQTDNGNPDVAYGCLILDFSYGGGDYVQSIYSMENNRYINNTVIADARQSYAFELWGGVNTQIIGNNMTSTGNYPMGIGAIGINTTINNNTIIADGISNDTEFSADWIKPRTAGIYVYGKMEGNTITNNTVAVTNGRAIQLDNAKNILVENNFLLSEDYAYVIEVTNGTNTFKYNAIMGEGTTEEVIKDTANDENIYINNREATTSTLTINTPENIILGYETQITISLKDDEENCIPNQYITVQIGEEEAQTLITDKQGNCIFPYTMTTQTAQITATYECYQNFGCTTTKEIHTIEPIILTPENFDTYITNGLLNENVPDGATIDVHGKFDNERYAFNITKPVNMLSTTGDAFFCFYSTPKLEGTSELPDYSFIITSEGSGTNITGINFENTMIVTKEAHDVVFDNITVYCTSGYGWGRGSTSIRNSQNVTIKNSYFNTTDNNGVSTVVFAASQNCLIENSTVCGSGFIGNLVYATTYNIEVIDEYGNNNITIRGNKIIGRDIAPGVATCYSVCLIGDNITVEDNYIENSNSYLIMTQYKDDEYEVAGNTGTLTIRNNEFDTGKISIKFDPCTIENNTFYGNVTITATNNTITNNNIQADESQNPYKNTTNNVHQTSVTIDAPDTYIYNDEITVNITVKDTTTNETLTNGLLEIYADGTPYKNITINSNTTSFTYNNETIGMHRIRAWYYSPTTEINNSQKVVSINATPILGELTLTTKENPQIGETITLTATYTLNKEVPLTTDFKFELPGQLQPIIITTDSHTATLNTTITTDYIRDILGGREQNIKITATTNNSNVEITGINTKLGVQKAQTSITITPTTTQVNNQTTITATITTPTNLTINTGTITFKDAENNTIGTYNVNNNQATITTQFNTIGTTQITATYSGTTYYEATTTTTPIEVTGKQEVIVTYEPISNVNFGENVTITGKFMTTNGKAITNSNVKIYINGVKYLAKTDKTGTYTLSVATTQTGTNKVSIGYSGNDKYEAYETNTTFQVLGKQPVTVTYEPISNVNFGENVTITGKFMTTNGKAITNSNVKIYINGVKYLAKTDKTGTYLLSVETTQTGVNKVSIGYSGNDKYESYETNTTFQVLGKQPVTVTYEPISNVNFGENVTITGKFMTSNGKAITNSNVKIYINGVKYLAKTDKTGTYTLSVATTQTGTNKVSIGYSGNDKYEAYETNTTFQVLGKQPVTVTYEPISNVNFGENVTITGKFMTSNGKAITNSNVKIYINGVKYLAKTDKTGTYTLSVATTQTGTNKVSIGYSGNDKYEAYETNTTFQVLGKQPVTVTYEPINNVKQGQNVTITGKFTTNTGKAITNTNVKILINGKKYYAKTDKTGTYTLSVATTQTGTNNVTIGYSGNDKYEAYETNTTFIVTA